LLIAIWVFYLLARSLVTQARRIVRIKARELRHEDGRRVHILESNLVSSDIMLITRPILSSSDSSLVRRS